MATFTRSDDLRGAEFVGADLHGARFVEADLSASWAATLDRAAAMPAGTVDVSVAGEWSFAHHCYAVRDLDAIDARP